MKPNREHFISQGENYTGLYSLHYVFCLANSFLMRKKIKQNLLKLILTETFVIT